MNGDELEFVKWLTDVTRAHPALRLGIGDDMASIEVPEGMVLISSDMLLDTVHFDIRSHDLRDVGRKAMACGLSDCAAMAVKPIAATVSIAAPKIMPLSQVQSVYEGIGATADAFDVALAGGDTTRWSGLLAIDVAVIASQYPGIQPVTRSGARAGDTLYVTGPLGGSLLGRHLDFTPRVREAETLARRLGPQLHAMMDISDGLALDLWRMCEASAAGATLDESLLQAVMSDHAVQAADADHKPALDHVLSDGEDFELLLAVAGDVRRAAVPLFPIGEITEAGLNIRRRDGRVDPLPATGFVH